MPRSNKKKTSVKTTKKKPTTRGRSRSTKKKSTTRKQSRSSSFSSKRKTSHSKSTKKNKHHSHRKKSIQKTQRTHSISKLRNKSAYGVPNKPWKELTSFRALDREKMPSQCFLEPATRGYPICFKNGRQPSCIGLQAAEKRAQLNKNQHIVNKARALQRQFRCDQPEGEWIHREREIYRTSKKK